MEPSTTEQWSMVGLSARASCPLGEKPKRTMAISTITHDYDEVDLDEVWKVVEENLPQLLSYIEPLVSNDDNPE